MLFVIPSDFFLLWQSIQHIFSHVADLDFDFLLDIYFDCLFGILRHIQTFYPAFHLEI